MYTHRTHFCSSPSKTVRHNGNETENKASASFFPKTLVSNTTKQISSDVRPRCGRLSIQLFMYVSVSKIRSVDRFYWLSACLQDKSGPAQRTDLRQFIALETLDHRRPNSWSQPSRFICRLNTIHSSSSDSIFGINLPLRRSFFPDEDKIR